MRLDALRDRLDCSTFAAVVTLLVRETEQAIAALKCRRFLGHAIDGAELQKLERTLTKLAQTKQSIERTL